MIFINTFLNLKCVFCNTTPCFPTYATEAKKALMQHINPSDSSSFFVVICETINYICSHKNSEPYISNAT